MADWLTRATPADLEVRSDGRTVHGIAVPFDSETKIIEPGGPLGIREYTEVFRQGAFARTIRERGPVKVKFLAQHNHQLLPIGRAHTLREDTAGLYVELRASKTVQADEVLELIRDGAIDALSIGFRPDQDRWNKALNYVERLAVRLHEISAVAFPAYEDALIGGVRSATPFLTPEAARLRLLELSR